jgi:tRNA dimethylallyltransferase
MTFPLSLSSRQPVLIAGPTASGKSALALHIAETQGGVIVNADALQVYAGWRILTARPSPADERRVPHALYGHIAPDQPYSAGQWLRDLRPWIAGPDRPIIVGGTGLNFSALTEGLADIPATSPEVRAKGDQLRLPDLVATLDPQTADRIDLRNRARVQRAWEVFHSTGRPLAQWQDDTPAPLLPLDSTLAIVVDAPPEWLTPRIGTRFDHMLDLGLLEEARGMKQGFDPAHPASKAIGAPEMMAYLDGDLPLHDLREAVVVQSRQYAKRQRTWFRKRMRRWHVLPVSSTDLPTTFRFLT